MSDKESAIQGLESLIRRVKRANSIEIIELETSKGITVIEDPLAKHEKYAYTGINQFNLSIVLNENQPQSITTRTYIDNGVITDYFNTSDCENNKEG